MSVRFTWATVDAAAITANAQRLKALAGDAHLLAVVKAFGYGHGAVQAAEAALAGGATWLGVALVEEGEALRRSGIAAPILVLSEPRPSAMAAVVAAGLRPTVYTAEGVDAAARAATGLHEPLPVHVKVDTGMHRVGATPEAALGLAEDVDRRPELRLEGLFTHFAVADEPERADHTAAQLAGLHAVADALASRGVRPELLHAANSAGLLAHPAARLDLVRCGIAVYGLTPSPALAGLTELRPALSLLAEVSFVKPLAAGQAVSYGLRWTAPIDTVVATIPIGYADGVPRAYGASGGQVLIGGRRCPVVGTVTMDQLLVDCGPGAAVAPGDECVLIGRQGDEEVTAWEWAERVGTIAYEVVCGLSSRVPRLWV
jgi:alanine racemase